MESFYQITIKTCCSKWESAKEDAGRAYVMGVLWDKTENSKMEGGINMANLQA